MFSVFTSIRRPIRTYGEATTGGDVRDCVNAAVDRNVSHVDQLTHHGEQRRIYHSDGHAPTGICTKQLVERPGERNLVGNNTMQWANITAFYTIIVQCAVQIATKNTRIIQY